MAVLCAVAEPAEAIADKGDVAEAIEDIAVAVLSAVAELVEAIADKGDASEAMAETSAEAFPNILVASTASASSATAIATAILSPELGIRLSVAAIEEVTCSVAVFSAVAEPAEAIAEKGNASEAIADSAVAVLSAVALAVAELAEVAEAIADKGDASEALAVSAASLLLDNSFNNLISPSLNASFFFLFQP